MPADAWISPPTRDSNHTIDATTPMPEATLSADCNVDPDPSHRTWRSPMLIAKYAL